MTFFGGFCGGRLGCYFDQIEYCVFLDLLRLLVVSA